MCAVEAKSAPQHTEARIHSADTCRLAAHAFSAPPPAKPTGREGPYPPASAPGARSFRAHEDDICVNATPRGEQR